MRHWLTPRCLLVALLLVAAPGAALAHLLVTWVPTRLALAGLNRSVAQCRSSSNRVTSKAVGCLRRSSG